MISQSEMKNVGRKLDEIRIIWHIGQTPTQIRKVADRSVRLMEVVICSNKAKKSIFKVDKLESFGSQQLVFSLSTKSSVEHAST